MQRNDWFKFMHINLNFRLDSVKLTSHPRRYDWISRYCLTQPDACSCDTCTKSRDCLLCSCGTYCSTHLVCNKCTQYRSGKPSIGEGFVQTSWCDYSHRLWDWSRSLWIYLKVQPRFVAFICKQARILQNKLVYCYTEWLNPKSV